MQKFRRKWHLLDTIVVFLVLIFSLSGYSGGPGSISIVSAEGDTEPPYIRIVYPEDGQTVSDTVIITVEASDNERVQFLELYIDGSRVASASYEGIISKLVFEGDVYEWTYQWDTSAYETGKHTIKATAHDESGNTATDEIAVLVEKTDSEPPVVEIVYPEDGQTVFGTVMIEIEASDNDNVQLLEIYINNDLVASAEEEPSWEYEWDTSGYGKRRYTIEVIAHDSSGNTASDEIAVFLGKGGEGDTEPPVVEILYPEDGQTVSGTVIITVEASDNDKIKLLELYIDGSRVAAASYEGLILKWAFERDVYEWGHKWDTLGHETGRHTVKVVAHDDSENTATDEIVVYLGEADFEPPVVEIVHPRNYQTVSDVVIIEIEASDNDKVQLLEIYIDDDLVASAEEEISWEYEWDTSALEKGRHTVEVVAQDRSGNTASDKIAVYVGNEDNDGDGYPPPEDCNDNDPQIHPGASEPCGEDYNCDGEVTPCTGDLEILVTAKEKGLEGCKIYLDGWYAGKTDSEGTLVIPGLDVSKEYIVKVEAEGYQPEEKTVRFEDDTITQVQIEMESEPESGILFIGILVCGAIAGFVIVTKRKPREKPSKPPPEPTQKPSEKPEKKEVETTDKETEIKEEVVTKVKRELKPVPTLSAIRKYCPYCGGEMGPDHIFCQTCGRKIEKKELQPSEKLKCPFCNHEIHRDWISCPYCGTRLMDDTMVY